MNRRILLLIFCILPCALFSQVYRYTKETRIEYNGKNAADTVYVLDNEVRIEVQITRNTVTVLRPRNGSGEPFNIEVYTIKKMHKGDQQTKITTKEYTNIIIYHDGQWIGVHYKRGNSRIDYGFYNGTNKVFSYERQ